MRALDRLRKSGFELPEPPPRHQFVPVAVVGDLAFVSGHAPYRDGGFRFKGKVGSKLDLSAAQQAAGLALLGCLRSLHDRFGTLDAVRRILKLNAYVNCVPNFRTPDLGAILRVEQENRMSQERGCGRGRWGEKLTARCPSYSFQFSLPM